MKEDSRPTNQVYEQLQLATGIQESRSKWRVHPTMKEEGGEEWRAMKVGDWSDEER
jgi:hypothetical protein